MKPACLFAVLAAMLCASGGGALFGQSEAALPLKKVSLYSSGVGFFEHAGGVSGAAAVTLPFAVGALNDALKSLVINDGGAGAGTVSYASENTYWKTLQNLKIDISGSRGIFDILRSMKGAEVSVGSAAQVLVPVPVTGRIVAVDTEERVTPRGERTSELTLTLNTSSGLRVIPVTDIRNIVFKDKEIQADLNRALSLSASYRAGGTRDVTIDLPGKGRREARVSYVIPSPVWKVSYRLDLDAAPPFLQGWAIVDNDGETDWNGVELSLVTGRQVSFVQNLYEPYYQNRPNLPLSVAGVAQARVYEDELMLDKAEGAQSAKRATAAPAPRAAYGRAANESAQFSVQAGGALTAGVARFSADDDNAPAQAGAAGEQFEFRFPKPVTLARQRSAMLPLVEASVQARKTLIFSGDREGLVNAQVSAELVNNTGMRLPAGPITVFDGGAYSGDALLAFFPEDEKRYISFGDDLSVSGASNTAATRFVQAARISRGALTVTRSVRYTRTYTIRNAAAEEKQIVIEHPRIRDAALAAPPSAESVTHSHYRFERTLPASGVLTLTVGEERPLEETVALARLSEETLLAYSSGAELPAAARAAFAEALKLRLAAEDARKNLAETDERHKRLQTEQERIRKNMDAVGRDTHAGAGYLSRLAALDGDIDACAADAAEARDLVRAAQTKYESYLQSLEL